MILMALKKWCLSDYTLFYSRNRIVQKIKSLSENLRGKRKLYPKTLEQIKFKTAVISFTVQMCSNNSA